MPRNGEINREFGVYKNLCCGAEIVIPKNVTFPDCAMHSNLPTVWKNVTNADRISHANELKSKSKTERDGKRKPAA
jgi:hypothetical protein